jgi:hypothetical protein
MRIEHEAAHAWLRRTQGLKEGWWMDISMAGWLQVALAALCLLTLAVALVMALRLRALATESVTLGDTETKTIVKLRLLQSRVSELESDVAAIARWQGSTDGVPELIDLTTPPTLRR